MAQHGWSDRHVEQPQPAAHGGQGFMDIAVGLLKGNRLQTNGDRDLSADGVLQQLLIEALHGGQNGKLPLRIFDQTRLLWTTPSKVNWQLKAATLVKTKLGLGTRVCWELGH